MDERAVRAALQHYLDHAGTDETSPTRSTTRTRSWSSRSRASGSRASRTSGSGDAATRPRSPSGARNWTTSRRQAYANDLGDSRPLAAVTDNVNQAKGDRDPATWMPPYASACCRYINEWVAVKIRWRLTVDSAAKSALTNWANNCPAATYAY